MRPGWTRRRRVVVPRCSAAATAVGIDLGTTNSAVSVMRDGAPVVVRNDEGSCTTPSAVTYLESGEVVVGRRARQMASRYPTSTFISIKRLLGKEYPPKPNHPFNAPLIAFRYQDAADEGRALGLEVMKGEGGETLLGCQNVPEGILRPEDVAAEVVRYLLKCASEELDGASIDRCVISVPAYFNDRQREATVAAVTFGP